MVGFEGLTVNGALEEPRAENLVPTARLELAQLSPLPPQDSVSTNFTTSANRKRFDKLVRIA